MRGVGLSVPKTAWRVGGKYPEIKLLRRASIFGWRNDVAAGISIPTRLIYLIEAHYDDHSG